MTPNPPQTGERLPPLALADLSGAPVLLSRFQGRLSLALFLAGKGSDPDGLGAITAIEAELRSWGAETLLVVAASASAARRLAQALGFAGITLVDTDGELHRRLGATDPAGQPRPALLIADRVAELRYRLDPPVAGAPPSPDQLAEAIGWGRYLGIQEPECGTCVPAWSPDLMEQTGK